MFQGVDQDFVSCIPGGKATNAHQAGDLADGDIESGAGHERRNGRQRDKINNPTGTNQANERDDAASDDCQCRRDDVAGKFGIRFGYFEDDITNNSGHDRHGLIRQYGSNGIDR